MLAVLAWAVFSGQTTSVSKAQDLEKEVTALRAENARLRAELEKTKADLARSGGPGTATQARAFASMADILVNAPAELRPQANAEWYKYTGGKFDAWWQAQLVGLSFDQTMTFESVNVTKSGAPKPGAEWNASLITFASKTFVYFGATHDWRIAMLSEQVDEAAARKWDATKKGTLFRVKGTVAGVEFAPDAAGSVHTKLPVYHVVLRLRDVEILPPKAN
jgi:hypothetical protein